jgi:hypothetical protein
MRVEMSAAEVARVMHWSLSKLNRIENNKVTIQPVEVEALARLYGVSDDDERQRLIELSVISRQRMWWREERLNENLLNFVAFENDATELCGYQPTVVPALLQTEAYARFATSSMVGLPPDDPAVWRLVDVRLRRQEMLLARLDGASPPTLSQVIDESVLHRPIGGAEVMEAQLDHLMAMAERPGIQVVVLPVRMSVHPGLGGAFELLTFADSRDIDVVLIETAATDFLLTDPGVTRMYRRIMTDLLALDSAGVGLEMAVAGAKRATAEAQGDTRRR